jgi:hypothetical protein
MEMARPQCDTPLLFGQGETSDSPQSRAPTNSNFLFEINLALTSSPCALLDSS